MKQKRNYTLTEQEENKIVNQIYNKKILLIKKLLETCHLTVMDLCVHLNIDTSTFHRWFQPNPCIISALKYTQVCVFFGTIYKREKNPSYERNYQADRRNRTVQHFFIVRFIAILA